MCGLDGEREPQRTYKGEMDYMDDMDCMDGERAPQRTHKGEMDCMDCTDGEGEPRGPTDGPA